MNKNKEACHCHSVTYGMIEAALRNGANTFEEVQAATGIARGCGKCRSIAEYLVNDIKEELEASQGEVQQ